MVRDTMTLSECMGKISRFFNKSFLPVALERVLPLTCRCKKASILSGSLIVKLCLFDLPRFQPCHLPVVIFNDSDHILVILARYAIEEMSALQAIIPNDSARV